MLTFVKSSFIFSMDSEKALNQKQQRDFLVLDLSKTFDIVAHHGLLHKLNYYGMRGSTLQWINSWLTAYMQSIVVDGDTSDEVHVASGVPQGTVLGHLLFLLYINDFVQGLNSTIKLFADDCILLRQINTEIDSITLQQDVDTVVQWSEKWQMSFNPHTCSVLTITKKKKIIFHHYKMSGVELAHMNQQAYLRLEFASDLSWGPQIQKIAPKTSRNLNMIRRNISNAPQVIKEQTYKSFIRQC